MNDFPCPIGLGIDNELPCRPVKLTVLTRPLVTKADPILAVEGQIVRSKNSTCIVMLFNLSLFFSFLYKYKFLLKVQAKNTEVQEKS